MQTLLGLSLGRNIFEPSALCWSGGKRKTRVINRFKLGWVKPLLAQSSCHYECAFVDQCCVLKVLAVRKGGTPSSSPVWGRQEKRECWRFLLSSVRGLETSK